MKPACRYCGHLKPDVRDEFGGMKCEFDLEEKGCKRFTLDGCFEGHDPRELRSVARGGQPRELERR